jgi:hypothetical protein
MPETIIKHAVEPSFRWLFGVVTISISSNYIDALLTTDNPSVAKVGLFLFKHLAPKSDDYTTVDLREIQVATRLSYGTVLRAVRELKRLAIIETRYQRFPNRPQGFRLRSQHLPLPETTKSVVQSEDAERNFDMEFQNWLGSRDAATALTELRNVRGIGICMNDLRAYFRETRFQSEVC